MLSAKAPRRTCPWALPGRRAPERARRADRAPRSADLAKGRRGLEAQIPRPRTSGSTKAHGSEERAREQPPTAWGDDSCVRSATASEGRHAEVASAPADRGIPAQPRSTGQGQDLDQRSSSAGHSGARALARPLRSRS